MALGYCQNFVCVQYLGNLLMEFDRAFVSAQNLMNEMMAFDQILHMY